MKAKIFVAAIAVASFVGCGSANASSVLITITSDTNPTLAFVMALNPHPGRIDPGYGFGWNNWEVTVNGSPAGLDAIAFFPDSNGGGLNDGIYFNYPDPGLAGLLGPQLYSGTEANPTFSLGSFAEIYSPDGNTFYNATVTITTATPLPAALPLFASGIGAIGLAAWRRKKKAKPAS